MSRAKIKSGSRSERRTRASSLDTDLHAEAPDLGGGTRDRQFVTALARGLEILACFHAGRPQMGGTEIASLLNLPQPTVWRLCRTITKLGYLATDKDDRLRPALPSLRLGFTALSDMTAAELVGPHLQELADEVGGAAGLAVRDGP
jgi:DNA-binding IclR family transcriptional regulator